MVRVCDRPDLTQDIGAEVDTTKDANGNIAGDDAKLLGVVLAEDLVYESELPLCRGEGCSHGGKGGLNDVSAAELQVTSVSDRSRLTPAALQSIHVMLSRALNKPRSFFLIWI